MAKRYRHPVAFEVISGTVGPYAAGERFKSDELTHDEGKHFVEEGLLRGLDPFGEPTEHEEDDGETPPHTEPEAEPESAPDAEPSFVVKASTAKPAARTRKR